MEMGIKMRKNVIRYLPIFAILKKCEKKIQKIGGYINGRWELYIDILADEIWR